MKQVKDLTIEKNNVVVLFDDGTQFSHTITNQELSLIENKNQTIENIIAKYIFRDSHAIVSIYRYINNKGEIISSPSGHSCGQCRHFQQTGVYYSETSIGCPDNGLPYPVGICQKHGWGPRLSAYHGADGMGCGWEIADWCKLDDKLTDVQERELRELWK